MTLGRVFVGSRSRRAGSDASCLSLLLALASLSFVLLSARSRVDTGSRAVPLTPVFTGIIEEVGTVTEVERSDGGLRLRLEAPLVSEGLVTGASVAVNGTCLTAVSVDGSGFLLEIVPETLQRTNLGALVTGGRVNLERAMRADGRFDGHIVQGHVDGVGTVRAVVPEGDGARITIEVPGELLNYVVEKGSITVDGVSLTVAALGDGTIEVALIPHTLEMTTLAGHTADDPVNLEVDVLAKYLERLVARR